MNVTHAMPGSLSIAGKTILYTGAAGGLGTETTLAFLRAGAKVVAIDNDHAKVANLLSRTKQQGLQGLTVSEADLSDLASLRARLETLSAEAGGFDVVINNAAIYPSKNFEEYTIEEFQAVQRINVDAGIVCVQVALPHMREQAWGRIINIASVTFYGGWAIQGRADRAHPRLGARVRAIWRDRQLRLAGRLPDRRGKNPPRPRRLHALRARPPGRQAPRRAQRHRQCADVFRVRRIRLHHWPVAQCRRRLGDAVTDIKE
jgi:NAD(P)-dependent dehydrogenase (short-subunit alcohol dehydrogenase family)